ncbi:unnamed protein product [Phaedon cochleariae]|uniref:Fork-head domain-containing protein n=1 Tax=Phaedon cochleariae TaxID=80249 RepID=A0A9N9SG30_PHACE|nr:unnamed protein product [Phaedon cochleariae]
MATMLLHTVLNSENLEEITLRFFESYHGQNEDDSAHSAISYAMKHAGNLFIPSQLYPVFKLARKQQPYDLIPLQFDDILDFKTLSKELRILNIKTTETGETFKWNDIMEFKNSIRHNLSLHNRFMRVQNEGTGKSSWWIINPDAKPGKSVRRRAASMETSKFEKKRGRAKKKVEMMRNGLPDTTPSPSSSVSEGYMNGQTSQQPPPPYTAPYEQFPGCRDMNTLHAASPYGLTQCPIHRIQTCSCLAPIKVEELIKHELNIEGSLDFNFPTHQHHNQQQQQHHHHHQQQQEMPGQVDGRSTSQPPSAPPSYSATVTTPSWVH